MLAWRLPKSCGIIHSSIMFRNNQTLFYNENFKSAHDYKFYLDLLSREKNLTNLEQFLIKHRVHSESTHTTNFKRQKFFSEKAKREHKKTLLNIRLIDKIKFSSFLLKFYLKTFREKRIKD